MQRTPRLILLVLVLAAFAVLAPVSPALEGRRRVTLPEGYPLAQHARPVISSDGMFGFVPSAQGQAVFAFSLRTGEVISQVKLDGYPLTIGLGESAERRLLAVTLWKAAAPSAVAIVDATDPAQLTVKCVFEAPEGVALAPLAIAEFANRLSHCIVSVTGPGGALLTFDTRTGEQVGAVTLEGAPDRIAVLERGGHTRVAVTNTDANEVQVVDVGGLGELLPVSSFSPAKGRVGATNNVVFDRNGAKAYVGAGEDLYTFAVDTGEVLDETPIGGAAGAVAVFHGPDRDEVLVVSPEAPGRGTGSGGAVLLRPAADGRLTEAQVFKTEGTDAIGPENNAEFSSDGVLAFLPSRSGALYSLDVSSGRVKARTPLRGSVGPIVAAPLADAVAAVTTDESGQYVELFPMRSGEVEEGWPGNGRDRDDRRDAGDERGTAPVLNRLQPDRVYVGRPRDLQVELRGSGIVEGAVVLAGTLELRADVSNGGKRAHFDLPAGEFASERSIVVQVRNPDGQVSNAVVLQVVSPGQPVINKVTPQDIYTGSGDLELHIRGSNFRNNATVRLSYEVDGDQRLKDLEATSINSEHLVATLPAGLRRRSQTYSLTVIDRDGALSSTPFELPVRGPVVTLVSPEHIVAGVRDLTLRIDGANFHRGVRVKIQRPVAPDDQDEPRFEAVSPRRVKRDGPTRIHVKLRRSDLPYSGSLVVRVINPVINAHHGESAGDYFDKTVAISGPVIESINPDPIIAGADSVSVVLKGTDFRRLARVKLQRVEPNGSFGESVVVERPDVKSSARIGLQFSSSRLAELISRPGSLDVRVVNPTSAARGDHSAVKSVALVGPKLDSGAFEQTRNPSNLRLRLLGNYFGAGLRVWLLDGNDVPLTRTAKLARRRSQTEAHLLVPRSRLGPNQTIRVRVTNPTRAGDEGIASATIEVAVP